MQGARRWPLHSSTRWPTRHTRTQYPQARNPDLAFIREVLEVMREVGIDLSTAKPQKLIEELARRADLLITMGCGEKCPYVPGLRRDDWPLRDPKGLPLDAVREIRNEVKKRVESLLQAENLSVRN